MVQQYPNMTELCEIAFKYGTDKCPRIGHTYTPFYHELLKDKRESIKKVLEIGIGYKRSWHIKLEQYVIGASLYMWRDFFPNAHIYGADIVPETLFQDERISTFLCDETKKGDLEKLIEKTGSDIDLFIDDGSHVLADQMFLCKTMMPLLKKDVIYIIEDVMLTGKITSALQEYECYVPELLSPYPDISLHPNPQMKIIKNNIVVVKNY